MFTVLYASGPIWTALLAYLLLRRRIGAAQQLALLVVMSGLAVAAHGSWLASPYDSAGHVTPTLTLTLTLTTLVSTRLW